MKNIYIGFMVLIILLSAIVVFGDTSDVIINGRKVSNAQIEAIISKFGMSGQVTIPPGTYWYDDISGLWGMQGGPTLGQVWPGLDLGGPLQADASGGGTQVFINGRELHPKEVDYLRGLFGYVLAGRYWLNAMGIGGYEGGPPLFNIYQAARNNPKGGGYGYTRRTPFGSTGGDGNCSYYLHPSGSSVMNCN